MFDGFGFFEIIIVCVIGLVVLGPERLPVAVRSVSRWFTTAKRMATSVRTELEQELKIEQLQTDLKTAESRGLKDLDPDLQKSIEQLRDAASSVTRPYAAPSSDADTAAAPKAEVSAEPAAASDAKPASPSSAAKD
ncbi:Sec-independent protein translocase protein TatB [Ferrimonas lipolytica]|uniref:Sec-independent protein translocase protein TatB n=1 Tax=Ferrimonas lipolytica TaxID=2724191 RepID=A0A6H1UFX1_9GAMM|nr:Sec-independent protein translocase protein TatB [Ferrimonas lipolytica]QIZ77981.1 Sec-independent protein translocase subunit TatB [Ferrimonas lipolytica]